MNTVITTTSVAGNHVTEMTSGILIRKVAGSFYVSHHFGGGETMSHGRYATEVAARRNAMFIAQQSNTPLATRK